MLILFAALALSASACVPRQAVPEAPDAPVVADTSFTDTERTVQQTIEQDGVHVVHFWAPWCGNSTNELAGGWYESINSHPDVTFTFVTIWNNGDSGQRTLDRFGIPKSAFVLAQPDHGPSGDHSLRRRTFLGLPLSWTPSTWIFNRNGKLAFASNYGELTPAELDAAIASASASWEH